MAVLPGDLIIPRGELQPAQFPDRDLAESINVWITQLDESGALIQLGPDAADRARAAFVYWRAFTTIADRLANTPDTERSSDRTTTWSSGRIQYWRQRGDYYRVLYESEIAAADAGSSADAEIHHTGVAPANYVW